jgi:hypothetical protein
MASQSNRIFTIAAGNRPAYEVEKAEDGTKVTFRIPEHPETNFEIAGSAIPDLIKVLQELAPFR